MHKGEMQITFALRWIENLKWLRSVSPLEPIEQKCSTPISLQRGNREGITYTELKFI